MDRLSPTRRSWNMSRIKSKDTTPERIVRSFLHKNGFRFRLHAKELPGTPDIVLPKYKIVIEVRGCYWHRHPGCKYSYVPKTRIGFWNKKFNENIQRDIQNARLLANAGYKVLTIWECEMSEELLNEVCLQIRGNDS